MNYYFDVLRKYAVFSGRARRKEYWMFFLFNILASFILTIVSKLIDTDFLTIIYGLAVIIPGLAVTVRRLHDIGRSGWWILIGLIPIVGVIVLLVFYATESQLGENKYGPNPKGVTV